MNCSLGSQCEEREGGRVVSSLDLDV